MAFLYEFCLSSGVTFAAVMGAGMETRWFGERERLEEVDWMDWMLAVGLMGLIGGLCNELVEEEA